MSEQVQVKFSEEAKAVLRRFQTLPDWALKALARGMNQANDIVISHIQRDYLTGVGPFPPADHKLGVVTNRLRGAVRASEATVSGQKVGSAIGDNVKYAAIHEFGGVIHRAAHSGTVRLRLTQRQELMRQTGYEHLAVFAKASHTRVKEVAYTAEAYDIHIPARAPFRTGITYNLAEYGNLMSQRLLEAWGRQN